MSSRTMTICDKCGKECDGHYWHIERIHYNYPIHYGGLPEGHSPLDFCDGCFDILGLSSEIPDIKGDE